MGGFRSGTWARANRKWTVEQSLCLPVSAFGSFFYPDGASFASTWSNDIGCQWSIAEVLRWGVPPTITLLYRWNDAEDVRIPVELQTTPTRFEGKRWWFTCPLIRNGEACQRRVGKLYLPPGARYFGCRKCYDLTYRSCQKAHWFERHETFLQRSEEWLAKKSVEWRKRDLRWRKRDLRWQRKHGPEPEWRSPEELDAMIENLLRDDTEPPKVILD